MNRDDKILNISYFIMIILIISFIVCVIWGFIVGFKEIIENREKEQYYTNLLLENERLKTIQEINKEEI